MFNKISDYIQQYHPDLISQLNDKMKELISATKDEGSFEKLPKDEKEKHLSNARSIIELLEKIKLMPASKKKLTHGHCIAPVFSSNLFICFQLNNSRSSS